MSRPRPQPWNRREFLATLTGASTAALVGLPPGRVAAEPPPETTRIRLFGVGLCPAPMYLAEELLRGEGFTDVTYLTFPEGGVGVYQRLGSGDLDIVQWFVAPFVVEVDRGTPIVFVAGVHAGCFELFGTDRVRAIRDLRGKTVAVPWRGPGPETFISTMMAYVGLDPRDVHFVVYPADESMGLLAAGRIDAYLGFPPAPQELRGRKIGSVVVNSAVDRPWSQYFCCLVAANNDFVQRHPVATKRAVRAILKATDLCALAPERAARYLVDRGLTSSYDYAFQSMKEIPYGKWRDHDPEDTVRFYALRLHEARVVRSSPKKIIAQGTDWRFLNELKKELKG
jgi:NitT/TauT family transport system substrate-binding protein